MSWVVKLARATLDTYHAAEPLPDSISGVNPARHDSTHIYKLSRNPHTERGISVAMRLLGTPGAVPYRVLKANTPTRSGIVSVPRIPGAQAIMYAKRPIDEMMHPHDLAHMTAAEWLMNVTDRHNENYMFSPKGVHSIDYGVGWDGYRNAGEQPDVRDSHIYKRSKLDHVLAPHVVNRFLAAEPHIKKLMMDAMHRDNHTQEAILLANSLFGDRIAKIRALQRLHPTGIPLNKLTSYPVGAA